uniref:Ig-like domain-containing protein n=1 Tax=Paramormyrops kingsleyae TaxID=1676925 RepID=A0A3B3RZU7_9TELE
MLVSFESSVSVESIAVYSQVGGTVALPCNNVIQSDCSSTTWIHASSEIKEYSKLVNDGKIKVSNLHEKIKVGSNCSLHIHNVSTADAGSYTCRQIISGKQRKYDTSVYLSVLTVTDLKPGSTMTLQCLLYTYRGPGQCNSYIFYTPTLRWVNDADSDLQKDPRYQIHTSSCDSNLTTELQWTDNNRKWGCQLTAKGEVKISHSYTTILSDMSVVVTDTITRPSTTPLGVFCTISAPSLIPSPMYLYRWQMNQQLIFVEYLKYFLNLERGEKHCKH